MKKMRALTLAGAGCLATEAALASSQTPSMAPDSQVAEVAIYHVSDPDGFPAVMSDVMKKLGEMPGLKECIHLRSLKSPDLFADVLLWNSMDEAVAAAKIVETDERFKPFLASISEMKLMNHFKPDFQDVSMQKFRSGGAAIEMAVYTVKDSKIQDQPRKNVYRSLTDTDSFLAGIPLSPAQEGEPYIDFIAWTSEKEGGATAQTMMGKPEHKAFFGNADQMTMFEFFEVYDMDGFCK